MKEEIITKMSKFTITEQAILLITRKDLNEEQMNYLREILNSCEMDWSYFVGSLIYNRVNGIAYKNLVKMGGVTRRIMFPLEAAYENIKKRTNLHCSEILKLDKYFEEAGINYAFLKGAVLNTMYYEFGERLSNDTDLLVDEKDLKKVDEILKRHGYIQGRVENNKVIPATQKEILFAKMNTYEVYPYVKWIGDECFPFHEIDINFKLENGARIEDVKDMLKHTMRIENSEYGIRTLDVDSFLIFLCIHHYREATMLLKILEGEDLTLYKYLDIHVFIKQTSIDWAKLISKAKLYDKEIEVYHTLWYTEHIYPGTIPNSVFSMFELKDYDFVDEYNVKDNSHERIKWKLDFYHRLCNVERRKEALEAAKDESEKLKKMITDLRD